MNTQAKRPSAHTKEERIQLLLFRLGADAASGHSELFGINVYKVREIVVAPQITAIVNAPKFASGLANVRGQLIPVIDLPQLTGCVPQTQSGIVLVTEFARTTQAFLVDEVVEIIELGWQHLLAADASSTGLISGVARIDGSAPNSRLAQVLDVEQIVASVFPGSQSPDPATIIVPEVKAPVGSVVLFADDSAVARAIVEQSLKAMNVQFLSVKNGVEAWEALGNFHDQAVQQGKAVHDVVALVLTDLEMPEMDGFTLTRNIKEDPRFSGIPVVVYSSLTGAASQGHASSVGADAYVAKFEPKELAESIRMILSSQGS